MSLAKEGVEEVGGGVIYFSGSGSRGRLAYVSRASRVQGFVVMVCCWADFARRGRRRLPGLTRGGWRFRPRSRTGVSRFYRSLLSLERMDPDPRATRKRILRLLPSADPATLAKVESILREARSTVTAFNRNPTGSIVAGPCPDCVAAGRLGLRPPANACEPWELRVTNSGSRLPRGSSCRPCSWSRRVGKPREAWPLWEEWHKSLETQGAALLPLKRARTA